MNKKVFLTALALVVTSGTVAFAQNINPTTVRALKPTSAREAQENRDASTKRNYDVSTRQRPDYDAAGKLAGQFKLLPSIDVTGGYNSNIRSTQASTIDALYSKLDPNLRIESQFARHKLNLFAGGNFTFYQGENDDNLQQLFVGNEAQIDVTDTLNLTGGMKYLNGDEQRAISNAAGFASVPKNPIEFAQFDVNGAINKKFNRVAVTLGTSFRNSDYEDGIALNGTPLNQDDRDNDRVGVNGRVTYDISPDYKVFAKSDFTDSAYDTGGATKRDSKGHRSAAGVEFAITNQVTGEAFAGYMQRDYDNFADVSEPYLGGRVNWYPTPLLSVYASADRDVRDTFFSGSNAVVVSDLGLGGAYEFRRNIIIKPNFGYSFGQYQGIAGSEKTMTAGSNVEYLLNRHLSFIGSYNYVNRNVANNPVLNILDYDQNIFFLTAKAKL